MNADAESPHGTPDETKRRVELYGKTYSKTTMFRELISRMPGKLKMIV